MRFAALTNPGTPTPSARNSSPPGRRVRGTAMISRSPNIAPTRLRFVHSDVGFVATR
ncbi:MAG: hypothetical protein U0S48_22365 [Solirubrobacteraceae bacterium]